MADRSLDRLERAQRVLEDYLTRRDAGEAVTLDALVAEQPDLAAELRELHAIFSQVPHALSADARAEADSQAALASQFASFTKQSLNERYQIQGEVGHGGMGAVYRVIDRKLDRPLAMKVMLGQATSAPTGKTPSVRPLQLARFLNEAKLTGQLDHPGIVPVHEVGVNAEGRAYFTMKLVNGQTLADVFERQSSGDPNWSTPRVLTVIERVCEAMAFAHERGVIHRDLKPANIMVGDFGETYVMDWGLARKLGGAEEIGGAAAEVDAELNAQLAQTRDGTVLGTPAYMSPEQARGEIATLGPQSDVYSLGAMLYQLIAGTPPHVRKDEKPSGQEVLARVVTGPPKRLDSPTTPLELIAICEKAMAQSAPERYGSVRELAQDLNRFVSGRTVVAFDTSAWAETKQWVRRNKALAAALAAVLLVSAGGAVAFQLKASESEQNAQTAQANAAEAQLAREEATRRANDVLSLSAQKDHDDLVAEAESLWPAHPEMIQAYEDWLRRARALIDGRPADEAKGLKKRPSLTEHKAKLAELRRDAKPLSESEIQAERESHPKYAELGAKQAEVLWRSRMLGDEPWPSETEVEAELAKESLPTDADALNTLAWPLVDPAKPIYGQEVRALILARRAVAAASEEKRCGIRDALAWAVFKVGRFAEALDEERTALSEPGGDALKPSAADLEKEVALWRGDELAKRREARDKLAADVAALDDLVNERRTYEFEDPEQEWWDRQLVKLVSDLEALRDPRTGLMNDVLAEPFGWGVAKRYAFAKTIAARSVNGPEAKRLWSEAIAAIRASPRYGGLELAPQMGLLPVGMDPNSELWEFAHLQTGEPAERGTDGRLIVNERTGVILVLVPGGSFRMGAQCDPELPSFDPYARENEKPVQEIVLDPFFISKFELGHAQLERLVGERAFGWSARNWKSEWCRDGRPPLGLLPATFLSWRESVIVLAWMDLALPTEAQWEYATRAGTSTPWWTGDQRKSLTSACNLMDSYAKDNGWPIWMGYDMWLDDGNTLLARIGSYRPNAWGLHDVVGNAWEWCEDTAEDYSTPARPHDGLRIGLPGNRRQLRGGAFSYTSLLARSSHRNDEFLDAKNATYGVRPSRSVVRPRD